jgi:hypothetical protein
MGEAKYSLYYPNDENNVWKNWDAIAIDYYNNYLGFSLC